VVNSTNRTLTLRVPAIKIFYLEFPWASARSSRIIGAARRPMVSGCVCALGPDEPSWPPGGARAATSWAP